MSAPITYTLDHLDRLSDERGIFEHATGTVRREEYGYCTDDNARLLVVMSREPDHGIAHRLSRIALDFLLEAQSIDGRFRNRMDTSGHWTDSPSVEDCWGRSIWAFGVAASQHPDHLIRKYAMRGFDSGIRHRSPWSRSMAFAALGAADVLADDHAHTLARELLVDTINLIGEITVGAWAWPEPRLRYANAALAEAVIAAGAALGSDADVDRGLAMLSWLLELETLPGHLSVTGVQGRGKKDRMPQFDQQPIEVAAMADACWRAYTITGDPSWIRGVQVAADWFTGANDTGIPMYDAISGGGFDGLQPESTNLNQGAESTLAFISTMQRACSLEIVS